LTGIVGIILGSLLWPPVTIAVAIFGGLAYAMLTKKIE
jgi:hypothetical protein